MASTTSLNESEMTVSRGIFNLRRPSQIQVTAVSDQINADS